MKILLLTPEYPPIGGGAANACSYLVRELRALGIELDVLTSSLTREIQIEDGPLGDIIRLPIGKKAIHYWTYQEAMRYVWQARRYVNSHSANSTYTLHHAFFTIPSALVAFVRKHRTPYLISIRGSDVPGFNNRFTVSHTLLRPMTRMLWRKADAVVSNSQGLRELAWMTMPGLDIQIIPNGISTEEFSPSTEEGRIINPRLRLLAVNRLIRRKGMDVLFQAIAGLRQEIGDVFDVEIVGEGNLQEELENLSIRLGINEVVRFKGAIRHESLPEVYRGADVFVLPSRAEGMSNALLEAMASGLPTLVTNTGGSSELVEDNGIVVPPDDSLALQLGLKRMLLDPELRLRMGQKSRQRAEQLSWRSVAKQYLALYEEIHRVHSQRSMTSGAH